MQTDPIAVTVFLPYCSFQAELSRAAILESLHEIEAALTEAGLTAADTESRITAVMSRSVAVSAQIATGEIAHEEGVAQIACGFLYAYTKEQGAGCLDVVRGITGCLAEQKLYLNAAGDLPAYERAVEDMRETAQDVLGYDEDEMVEQTPAKPTMH